MYRRKLSRCSICFYNIKVKCFQAFIRGGIEIERAYTNISSTGGSSIGFVLLNYETMFD